MKTALRLTLAALGLGNGQADVVSAEAEDPAKEGQARVLITPDAKIARQRVQARGLEAVVTWLGRAGT